MPTTDWRADSATATTLDRLRRRESAIKRDGEAMLLEIRAQRGADATLTGPEQTRFAAYQAELRGIGDRIAEEQSEFDRMGQLPEALRGGGGGARRMHPKAASMLSPMTFSEQALRSAHDRARRGESAVLESRDFTSASSLIPPELFAIPTFPRHEARLMDRLPGYALDAPSLEYVQVNTVTGAAGIVGEGQPKPELHLPATKLICTALKLAVHAGISWENLQDYDAFTAAVQNELMKQVIDLENHQLVYGTGGGTQLDGMTTTTGILTFAATGSAGANPNNFDDIAGAIAALRTGPALAEPDLLLLHPDSWASIRTQKAAGTGMYFVSPDPSRDQVQQVWGVDVIESTAFVAGEGVLLDSQLMGRVAVREPLVLRMGYGVVGGVSDFVSNIVRWVCEERLNLAVERPAAICHITGLPTAAPTTADTKTATKR
jgi:HK97 family phage major capsid protein